MSDNDSLLEKRTIALEKDNKRRRNGFRWWIVTSFDTDEVTSEDGCVKYFEKIFNIFGCRALLGQIEKTGTTDRQHGQFVMYFSNFKYLQGLKVINDGYHYEPVVNYSKSLEYCSKEDTRVFGPFSKGDFPNRAITTTTDWSSILAYAESGQFDRIPPRLMIVYNSQINRIRSSQPAQLKILDRVRGVWIFGLPGTCKTKFVHTMYNSLKYSRSGTPYSTLYVKPITKWWDRFVQNRHDNVLLDEFEPQHVQFLSTYLKLWADAYTFQAEVKGSTVVPEYDNFVIASNYNIDVCFKDDSILRDAIRRRYLFIEWLDVRFTESKVVKLIYPIKMTLGQLKALVPTPSVDKMSYAHMKWSYDTISKIATFWNKEYEVNDVMFYFKIHDSEVYFILFEYTGELFIEVIDSNEIFYDILKKKIENRINDMFTPEFSLKTYNSVDSSAETDKEDSGVYDDEVPSIHEDELSRYSFN